jgi:hypothetical protein
MVMETSGFPEPMGIIFNRIIMNSNEVTSISLSGEWDHSVSADVQNAWLATMGMHFKIPDWVRDMDGMSGKKYRCFINNLVGITDDARYIEIGTWAGSTACSALYGNKVKGVCIDNWSEFGGPKDRFLSNVERVKCSDIDFRFIEDDFRNVDYSSIGKFNIYMFDGPHKHEDQYDALIKVLPALDDVFVFVVDDWNWESVRTGTLQAIAETNCKVMSCIEIRTTTDNSHPLTHTHQNSDWHNGYFIAVIEQHGVTP